jgi:outer membrane protein assembly factor BamD (BamD/ComL family)
MREKKYILFTVIIALAVLSGCGPSKEKSVKTITSLENRLFSPAATGFDKVKADSLLSAYESFMKHFPKDSLTRKITFKAANLSMNMGNGEKAIEIFDKFIEKYPDDPKAAVSMFFKGYIYENEIKNLDKAKEVYLQFIDKYPNNDFTRDARIALQNLGKSPEVMVKEFEERQKADSIRVADSLAASKSVKHHKWKKQT